MKSCIALCTYNPNPLFFKRQIDSIRSQDRDGWKCIVVDDNSKEDSKVLIRNLLLGDPRFEVYFESSNVGVVSNFYRALERALNTDSELIFLCDQDDVWVPNKIALMSDQFEKRKGALLLYSDLSLIDEFDHVTERSVFSAEARVVPKTIWDCVVSNSVTGAATAIRSSLARDYIRFNQSRSSIMLHDQFLACLAYIQNGLEFIKTPLVLYRQHEANVVGALSRQKITNHIRPKSQWKIPLFYLRRVVSFLRHIPINAKLQAALTQQIVDQLNIASAELGFYSGLKYGSMEHFKAIFKNAMKPGLAKLLSLYCLVGALFYRRRIT